MFSVPSQNKTPLGEKKMLQQRQEGNGCPPFCSYVKCQYHFEIIGRKFGLPAMKLRVWTRTQFLDDFETNVHCTVNTDGSFELPCQWVRHRSQFSFADLSYTGLFTQCIFSNLKCVFNVPMLNV